MLDLFDFLTTLETDVEEFSQQWAEKHFKNPEVYPLSLTSRCEWMEHFMEFMEERGRDVSRHKQSNDSSDSGTK